MRVPHIDTRPDHNLLRGIASQQVKHRFIVVTTRGKLARFMNEHNNRRYTRRVYELTVDQSTIGPGRQGSNIVISTNNSKSLAKNNFCHKENVPGLVSTRAPPLPCLVTHSRAPLCPLLSSLHQ